MKYILNINKLSYKRWINYFFGFILSVLVVSMSINFIVDPYQQYRKASFYTFIVQEQRSLNAGLIKNYDYDSVLLGTSMVENFNTDDIENILGFKKVIKLPIQGGSLYEEMATLKLVLETKEIKNILFGLDIFSFSSKQYQEKYSSRFPFYLYDDNILNDIPYLFNYKIVKKSFKSVRTKYNSSIVEENLNTLYGWYDKYKRQYKVVNVKNDYNSYIKKIKIRDKIDFSFQLFKENFDTQFLPIVESTQSIDYYIFFPPYSVLAYKYFEKMGSLDDYIKFKKYIFQRLKKYKNIKIYDFQSDDIITNNLNNYKDITHYSAKINYMILESIANNRLLIDESNIDIYSDKLKQQVNTYKIK